MLGKYLPLSHISNHMYLKKYITLIIDIHHRIHVEVIDNLQVLVLSFYHAGPGDQTPVNKFDGKCPYY